jgi:hypothetical protein
MSNTTLEHTAKTQTDAITKSGKAAIAGFQELAKAYQHLAIKNSDRLSSSQVDSRRVHHRLRARA